MAERGQLTHGLSVDSSCGWQEEELGRDYQRVIQGTSQTKDATRTAEVTTM